MQYLVSKKWRNILVLQGPLPRDKEIAAALARSAKRLGATLTTKPFQLTNDPRLREQSNVALMTAGGGEDVVWVIDSDGDFARYVPYQVNQPRPVVGSAGLVAQAWTWAWDEHGALQLEARFEKLAGRRMDSEDWAAWAAVKALVEASLRTNSTDFAKLRDFLLGNRLSIDGYKGNPMSFRPWDHQMRQPMLIATENAVIARAPIAGFLHQTDVLDTLGVDKPESRCAF
jgi:ABC transporter substrate binding protein (PQQ-dependent alcohol dehydrogenase system)